MKKCPECKAEIQENARFCLYCMTSFEGKQTIETPKEKSKCRPQIVGVTVIIVFIAMLLCVFLFTQKNNLSTELNDKSSGLFNNNNSEVLSDNITESNRQSNSDLDSSVELSYNSNQISDTQRDGEETTNKTNDFLSAVDSPHNSVSSNDTTNITSTNSTSVTYFYRDAQYGDDFFVGTNLENCVVITGVESASENGEYVIPETIDGKNVIAIMSLAFCGDDISNTVKKVVVPSTVKTIWNNAFANCYNLTDIYFCGSSIYTEADAFAKVSLRNGTLVIHCSENCNDRNFRYYKNSAPDYDAKFEEWNG